MFLALPLPVTAAQILWINLVSDGLPDLALTVDPKRAGIMKEPPRDVAEPLVAAWMKKMIILISPFSGFSALLLFALILNTTGDEKIARSVAFVTLGINSLVYVFSVKTLTRPFWQEEVFGNKWLLGAVVAGLGLQIVPFVVPSARNFFDVKSLEIEYWILAVAVSAIMFAMIEITKVVFRQRILR